MGIIDEKWEGIFEKYGVEREIQRNGLFYITADQIREFKEPRLMTKFDTRESLPRVFDGKIGILPVTRGRYVLGNFDLYQELPEFTPEITQITSVRIPDYFQTININEITSEANAINVMGIASILDDFMGEVGLTQTISGRMGSGSFSFQVGDTKGGRSSRIEVKNSQVEIDGGFENRNLFAVIEGKNVVHSNFLIRQLYYPYRLWENKLSKPVCPVFLIYSNNVFRLLEYRFMDTGDYNSIRLVREKNYSLEDVKITVEDLRRALVESRCQKEDGRVPFIQADSFHKVISLVENLGESSLDSAEIAERFGFRERQSDYYFNACRYLGLAEKRKDEDGQKRAVLTERGRGLLKMKYKGRQLAYVGAVLEHEIFRMLFGQTLDRGRVPDKRLIIGCIRELRLCGESLAERRASTVSAWLKWMLELAV